MNANWSKEGIETLDKLVKCIFLFMLVSRIGSFSPFVSSSLSVVSLYLDIVCSLN